MYEYNGKECVAPSNYTPQYLLIEYDLSFKVAIMEV
jgi:hypothetical protein